MAGSKIKGMLSPTLKDGTKPKRKIMLYGFFGHNLGDDVFFDILLKRYPDTLFYVFFHAHYEPFFEKYNNVRYYPYERPLVDKINRFGGKFKNGMLFEEILLRLCDAAVHIGGSVYQQIGDYENDLSIRKKRHRHAKRFFGITNNFGPFYTEDYKTTWETEFKKFTALSFRDKYSYDLFSHLKNVTWAPDLLFSLDPPEGAVTKEKTVAISVINPRAEFRKMEKEKADGYMTALEELTKALTDKGYTVSLLGFCNLEDDTDAINEIYESLPENSKKSVKLCPYTNDFSDTLDILARSEYVVSTRFHASVLGYAFSKKVLPVSYNIKVTNMLNDLSVSDYIEFDEIGKYSGEELIGMLLKAAPHDIRDIKKSALSHFKALDDFIEKKGGKIVR
ncbi:MAG: polysaccharide pyruvyl transferase family protein [Clostridia bacterium]|nr:polysaccharide pyruvyl transferase family protein [Clostridia bacterium]